MPTSPVYKRKDRVHKLPCVIQPHHGQTQGFVGRKRGYIILRKKYNLYFHL